MRRKVCKDISTRLHNQARSDQLTGQEVGEDAEYEDCYEELECTDQGSGSP